jgi:hypothetical protein
MNKIEPTINSQHLSYFTEYLENVSEKPPRKYDKKIEKTRAFDPALKIILAWTAAVESENPPQRPALASLARAPVE